MNISRQIGWGTESNLLYQILKQLNRLTSIMFGLKPKYKVYTALLTQNGASSVVAITSGSLTKGVTYNVTSASGGCDFTNVGGPSGITANGLSFVATENLEPNNWDGSELEYNTGAPVVTVLENTIGNIWFIYSGVGSYNIYSSSLFTVNKTTTITSQTGYNTPGIILIYPATIPDFISIETYDFTLIGSDDILGYTTLEIRLYN
jgi:hypothetical protein